MSEQKVEHRADLEAAKIAIGRKDWPEARRLLTQLVNQNAHGSAAFLLARVEFEECQPDAAELLLDAFQQERPLHAGALLLRSRLNLARGDLAKARITVEALLKIDREHRPALKLLHELVAQENAKTARNHIAVVEGLYVESRERGPTDALLDAAEGIAALAPRPNWPDDVIQAKIAYFHFADDLKRALRNYDPHLIELSTRLGYLTWPKRIQEFVRGKSVIDVGCGFGGFGMGFLVAGAAEYVGLDPAMKLDSTRAKNKRTRTWSDMGVTPRMIAQDLPAIRLFEGTSEELAFDEKFDTVALHNVTEHLMQLDLVFKGLVRLCKPDTNVVYLHHNYYCWNGHHFAPNAPHQLDESDPKHLELYDWHHIDNMARLPADHYINTHLNRVRLDEIRDITEKYFDIETWDELPSSAETLVRLTPEILERVRRTMPDITEREMKANVVFCIAKPKRS